MSDSEQNESVNSNACVWLQICGNCLGEHSQSRFAGCIAFGWRRCGPIRAEQSLEIFDSEHLHH